MEVVLTDMGKTAPECNCIQGTLMAYIVAGTTNTCIGGIGFRR